MVQLELNWRIKGPIIHRRRYKAWCSSLEFIHGAPFLCFEGAENTWLETTWRWPWPMKSRERSQMARRSPSTRRQATCGKQTCSSSAKKRNIFSIRKKEKQTYSRLWYVSAHRDRRREEGSDDPLCRPRPPCGTVRWISPGCFCTAIARSSFGLGELSLVEKGPYMRHISPCSILARY